MGDSRVMKHLNSRLFALEETQNKANQGVFYARKKGFKRRHPKTWKRGINSANSRGEIAINVM